MRPDAQLLKMASLLQLQQRVRWASDAELRFVIVNETKKLIPYEQGFLWTYNPANHLRITAASGVVTPDANAPQVQAMRRVLKGHTQDQAVTTIEADGRHIVCLTLKGAGYVLFARGQPWTDSELHVLGYLQDAYSHALYRQRQKTPWWARLLRRKVLLAGVVAALILAMLPVRMSVLVPAEVIAADPVLVRAPLEGVIGTLLVKPGQAVKAGDVLLQFDTEELTTRLAVAQQVLQVAQTDYRQISQASLNDTQERIRLASADGSVKTALNDLAYIDSLLTRTQVIAPQDGVVILDDPYDWIGRSVRLGERIMLLADPAHTRLEAHIRANDAIDVDTQSPVRFFPTVNPHRPAEATLDRISYRANQTHTPDGGFAYRATAHWTGDTSVTLGMKGTAKLYGQRLPLILHPVRKPLIWVRQRLGL